MASCRLALASLWLLLAAARAFVPLRPPLRRAVRLPAPQLAVDADTLLAQSEVLEVLSEVKDVSLVDLAAEGEGAADVVSLGLVRSVVVDPGDRDLSVAIELPIDAASAGAEERIRQQCDRLLREKLDWVGDISISVVIQATKGPAAEDLSPLRALADNSGLSEAVAGSSVVPGVGQVGHIVAVASCKGGVGKSTTAVNLAYSLAAAGERVGIVDLDVHGPSLPTMVRPKEGLQLDGEV